MNEENKRKKRQSLLDGLQVADGLLEGLVDEIEIDRISVSFSVDGLPFIWFRVNDYNQAAAFARKLGDSDEPFVAGDLVHWGTEITDGKRRYKVTIATNPPVQSRIERLRAELAKAEAEAAA